MPFRHARSSIGLRPGHRRRRCATASSGRMRSPSASLTFRSFTCAPVAVSDRTAGLSSNRTLSSLVVRRVAPEDFFPQRRREARQDGRDLLGAGLLQQPGK